MGLTKQGIQNLLLVLASTGITLILLEVAFRAYAYFDRNTLEELNESVELPAAGEPVTLGRMVRLNDNQNIIYDLIPNLSVEFFGQPVTINEYGFRGDLVTPAKSSGVKRIVGIGDSFMFGWGVGDHETYLAKLSEQLNASSGCEWEVINTAVPGYNTVMEVETLKTKGLAYAPDYVVIGFVPNDLSLPSFVRRKENYLSLEKSYLLSFFRRPPSGNHLVELQNKNWWLVDQEEELIARAPPEFRAMIGLDAYISAMQELQRLSIAHDFEVIVISHSRSQGKDPLHRSVKKTSANLGFKLLWFYDIWTGYLRESGGSESDNTYRLNDNDVHPSPLAHKLIASALTKTIIQETAACAK